MTILMPHIAERLFNEPLMVDVGKLSAILVGLGGRIVDGGVELSGVAPRDHVAFASGRPSDHMGKVGEPLRHMTSDRRIYSQVGPVAVIPVEGTLVHKGKWIGQSSGQTSYEGLQAQITRAREDDAVKAVVLEVDSAGGQVAGAFETARMMRELSAAKPTLAVLTDFALSAGYLLASQARRIVMPDTGAAGSIGVVTLHADLSKKLERDGIKVSIIQSGAFKSEGNPAEPLTDDSRSAIQARVDATRELFAAAGEGRGARLDRAAAMATEARIYQGEEARSIGLVDGIIDPQTAFRAFLKSV
jgi:signal peptide peptidase SppA